MAVTTVAQFATELNRPATTLLEQLEAAGVAKRSAFVIDKNGIVQYAEVQDHPKDLPNFDAIKAVLAK